MDNKKSKKEKRAKSCLDEDTLSYFKRVENVLEEDDFEDDEARNLFVENVFTQVEGNELELSCDQNLSRILEKLLILLNDTQIGTLWSNLDTNFKAITTNRFGSHVIQNLVNLVPSIIRTQRRRVKDVKRFDKEPCIEELFLKYCKFIVEELEELTRNIYGSHVVRAVLEVLGGVRVTDKVQRSRNSKDIRRNTFNLTDQGSGQHLKAVGQAAGKTHAMPASQSMAVPESFSAVLKSLAAAIMDLEMQEVVYDPVSSPVLQTALLVLHHKNEKLCSKLCKRIIRQAEMFEESKNTQEKGNDKKENKEEGDDESKDSTERFTIPVILSHEVSSHLFEKILHVATPKLRKKLYKTFFKSHLDDLVLHPVSNYLVQHLLATITDLAQGEAILDELFPEMEDILAAGHDGVIARMVETCVRMGIRQQELTGALVEAFHCTGKKERKDCARLILTITTHDVFYDKEKSESDSKDESEEMDNSNEEKKPRLDRVNFHGTVLMKSLFEFDDVKVFADSFLGLTNEELSLVSCDQMGSRVVEGFLRGKNVGEKRKHKLICKLKGEFGRFATDRHASHVVDTCWRESDAHHRESISQELLDAEHKLARDFYGAKVLKNCAIESFKRKKKGWDKRQENATRKRQQFEEIINATDKEKKSKKKRAELGSVASKFHTEMTLLGFNTEDAQGELSEEKVKGKQREKETTDTSDAIEMIFNQTLADSKKVVRKRNEEKTKQDNRMVGGHAGEICSKSKKKTHNTSIA